MQTFACKKCGSLDVFIKESGSQTGLYCGDCGAWLKWLGKEEKRLVERYIESREEQWSKERKTYNEVMDIVNNLCNKLDKEYIIQVCHSDDLVISIGDQYYKISVAAIDKNKI